MYLKKGEFDKALENFNKNKTILEKCYTKDYWKVGEIYNYLGVAMHGKNDY